MILRISNWQRYFDGSGLSLPSDLDYYSDLINEPDGALHLTAFVTMAKIATGCPHGILVRDGRPLTPRRFSMDSRFPADVFRNSIPRLLELRWIEECGDLDAAKAIIISLKKVFRPAIPASIRIEIRSLPCAACGTRADIEIDHIIPFSKGGSSFRGNLQALCYRCNRHKRGRLITNAALRLEVTER